MKKTIRILLWAVAVLLIAALTLAVPTGSMLSEYKRQWSDWTEDEDALLRLLVPTAYAEEAPASLPIDFTPGMQPNPAAYTENGYEDDSIRVELEHVVDDEKKVSWWIARITVKDPSQLRTGIAGNNLDSGKTATLAAMTEKYNAVFAINGDYYINDEAKKSFEYRMGQEIRSKKNATKDILIIDENGDFHIIIAKPKAEEQKEIDAILAEHQIINAFTFGPALIKDGDLLTCTYPYNYNPTGGEPRMAIGQTGPLSYVAVLAEGRGGQSEGVNHQELANFIYDHTDCIQAYNLDGGNSACMVLNDLILKGDTKTPKLRNTNDCIYFATTVDPATWSK